MENFDEESYNTISNKIIKLNRETNLDLKQKEAIVKSKQKIKDEMFKERFEKPIIDMGFEKPMEIKIDMPIIDLGALNETFGNVSSINKNLNRSSFVLGATTNLFGNAGAVPKHTIINTKNDVSFIELQKITAELEFIKERNKILSAENLNLINKIKDLQGRIVSLENERNELQKQLKLYEIENEVLKTRAASLEKQLDAYNLLLYQKDVEIQKLINDNNFLTNKINEAQQILNSQTEKLNDEATKQYSLKIKELTDKLHEYKKICNDLQKEIIGKNKLLLEKERLEVINRNEIIKLPITQIKEISEPKEYKPPINLVSESSLPPEYYLKAIEKEYKSKHTF